MRAKILLLLAATLVMAARASAVTITRGPIIENPDAVTSMITIAWWTDTAGDSTVDYGVNSAALLFSNTVPQALSGLSPGTRYYYRLKVGGVIVQNTGSSGPYFTTLKDPTDTTDLFFTIIGDWGQASGHEQSVSNLQDAADPQMIVTVGDNAYQNGAQSDWDNNALAYYANPMKRVTFFPTLGNHDLNSVGASSWASSVEIKMFALPRNGTDQDIGQRHGILDTLDGEDGNNGRCLEQRGEVVLLGSRGHRCRFFTWLPGERSPAGAASSGAWHSPE